MEKPKHKLSNVIVDQIKDFNHKNLTKEQEALVDKLILDEELKERYKEHGLCVECDHPNDGGHWCQPCNANHFKQYFDNWTSGNHQIDEFIKRVQLVAKNSGRVIEWIDYNKFKDVEYVGKGKFGTTSRATWKDGCVQGWDFENNEWRRRGEEKVALIALNNSKDATDEFLREVEIYIIMSSSMNVVRCHGITKDPETGNFVMVMHFAKNGSLRQHLTKNFKSLSWVEKLQLFQGIANGLMNIHLNGLVHRNFHCGNILSGTRCFITGLGLCQKKNSQCDKKKRFGVLPYVAPEVLRGKDYTEASDIYGFGIIAHEVCTGIPPYYDIAHDEFLAIRICNGFRPKSDNYEIPKLILDMIQQCWDVDSSKRPRAEELYKSISDLLDNVSDENSLIYKQIKGADEINKRPKELSSNIPYNTHPQAVYISRLLDFKNLPEPKNADSY